MMKRARRNHSPAFEMFYVGNMKGGGRIYKQT